MSQTPTDPTAGGDAATQEPSEDEVRAYLAQLRSAPAGQVLTEILQSLLNAAQVKLGRRDGRLLLDASAALTTEARDALPQELQTQLGEVLSQLRLAQVEAEKEVAQAAQQGQIEENDLPEPGAGGASTPSGDDAAADAAGAGHDAPPAQAPGSDGPASDGGGRGTSRLWVPGA